MSPAWVNHRWWGILVASGNSLVGRLVSNPDSFHRQSHSEYSNEIQLETISSTEPSSISRLHFCVHGCFCLSLSIKNKPLGQNSKKLFSSQSSSQRNSKKNGEIFDLRRPWCFCRVQMSNERKQLQTWRDLDVLSFSSLEANSFRSGFPYFHKRSLGAIKR